MRKSWSCYSEALVTLSCGILQLQHFGSQLYYCLICCSEWTSKKLQLYGGMLLYHFHSKIGQFKFPLEPRHKYYITLWKTLAFDGLLRWEMIIMYGSVPILTTSFMHFFMGECTFRTWRVKGCFSIVSCVGFGLCPMAVSVFTLIVFNPNPVLMCS